MPRLRAGLVLALACSACAASESNKTTGDKTTGESDKTTGERDKTTGDAPPPVGLEPRSCGSTGPRHHAFLASGSCSDVPGKEGKWLARPLFPDAPPAIKSTACTYRWSSLTSAPEVELLSALQPEHMTPSCEPETDGSITLRGVAEQRLAGDPSAPTGVSGCDVCAKVDGRHVYLILPPDSVRTRTTVITTKSEQVVSFDLKSPNLGAQAFVVELPEAPNGSTWKPGHITLSNKSEL